MACEKFTKVVDTLLAHPAIDVNLLDVRSLFSRAMSSLRISSVRFAFLFETFVGVPVLKAGIPPIVDGSLSGHTDITAKLLARPDIDLALSTGPPHARVQSEVQGPRSRFIFPSFDAIT